MKFEDYGVTIPLPSWFDKSGVSWPLPELRPIATLTVPVRTVSEANRHEHWRYRQKRAKAQRDATTVALREWIRKLVYSEPVTHALIAQIRASSPTVLTDNPWDWMTRAAWRYLQLPAHVHLTRLASRKLDSDNLAGALKHCRDAVAQFLGVDDGDESKVTWSVSQEQQKGYAIRIEFYRRGG